MYLFLTAYLLLAIPSAAAVLRQKQTPVVAIAWLLAIVLLPIGGSLFYLLAGYRKPVRDVPPTDSRPAAGIERMLWYGCSTRVRIMPSRRSNISSIESSSLFSSIDPASCFI